MKLITKYIGVWLAVWLLASCADKTCFTVEGVVSGADGQTLYLENVGIAEVQILDSVKLPPGNSNSNKNVLLIRIFIA